MAVSIRYVVLICIFTTASWIGFVSSSSVSTSTCPLQSNTFLHDLQLQCPHTISAFSPIEMDGESLDQTLSSSTDIYMAVLFYASWCPFSSGVRTKFAALSAMFPQIKHVMVEQSSAMPSVLSRYGIHSLPSILIVNGETRMRYHGSKDLRSIVHFYNRATAFSHMGYSLKLLFPSDPLPWIDYRMHGKFIFALPFASFFKFHYGFARRPCSYPGLDPVVDLTEDLVSYSQSSHKLTHPWKGNSVKEILRREPYLVFSALFLFLRVFLYFFPEIISRLIALWVACIAHLRVGVFGESSQLLGRVLHLIDVKRAWSKLKLCKTRNFHNGARNARVWASSLASVSLGETTSARSCASGDS